MKNERGQALPMAMVALIIGALVVVPFLSHAGTSLQDSRVYANEFNTRDAADAGAEHALWALSWSTLKTLIPNPGDQYTYALPEAVNGYTPSITVKMTAKGGGTNPPGTINKTILDTLVYDAVASYMPDVIKVSDTICAIVYRGPSNRGYLISVSIAPDGTISNSVLDTLIFDTKACYEPDIIHISGDYYAVAYRGDKNSGFIITAVISPTTGAISNAVVSSLKYDAGGGYEPDISYVSGTYYAIAYRGTANDGFLKTVTISSAGVIGGTVVSSYKFENDCYTPSIVQVASTVYAVTYSGKNNVGLVKTFTINSAGIITAAAISTLTFNATAIYVPVIINVTGNIYVIAFQGSGNSGLKTISIASNGAIGASVISTYLFETANSFTPDIVQVASNIYAVAYANSANKGYLKTVTIAADGTIAQTAIDTFNFDATACYEPSIIYLFGDVYGIAYRQSANKGYFITIGISSSAGVSTYEITSTAGSIAIKAVVDLQDNLATIRSWYVNQ
jgi:hypothetical protein